MKVLRRFGVSVCLLVAVAGHTQRVQEWLTTPDRKALVAEQVPTAFVKQSPAVETIIVDPKQKMQTMDGFGFALTGGSAQLMQKMSPAARTALIHELLETTDKGIGVSYLRVSIGASDMNDRVFSYDDLPPGEEDRSLLRFSLREDEADVIPVLREVLKISPKIAIMASPWTAPSWMKTNGDPKGGKLKPEMYGTYAAYLVKYLEGMEAEGIPITALTVQNEPLNPKNTPSMVMEAEEQKIFIRDHLGPALRRSKLKTKIILYDHNMDEPGYPMTTLKDKAAAKYVAGSGFHLYLGKAEAMSTVHDAFPQKGLYFTEQMIVDRKGATGLAIAAPVKRVIVGATRNWAKSVLLWNLAADPQFGPHTSNGGCPVCEGAITLDGDTVTRNLAFYTLAHASKFVPPGSVRVGSTETDELADVAFRTRARKLVLIVANTSADEKSFAVRDGNKVFEAKLTAGAVATYVW
ncbi:glycoside hydrolase family 30 protein [Terriglobus saanensis]|uniref:Glucan endo-1,6-beta-glucosidase n=1 Tax=Terriglobus saanensis (strain ATCC BAA-1853 / DSM 23119 / SP1PR4) TaxID=401053 RepID=E8UZZ9_TERSS|nr:glycoside hydrolase family 30 beta sandwich domain-containing protein [Terriglobus saanensis]ADV82154.1 Glucan endo-1,6-beta-glucosidase [Terriglobus saanensis SP1PR4]